MSFATVADRYVIAEAEFATREWLQAADVIVVRRRWRWRVSRHLRRTRDLYPGCVVVVARHTGGRWCVVLLPDRAVLVRGQGVTEALPAIVGAAYSYVTGG